MSKVIQLQRILPFRHLLVGAAVIVAATLVIYGKDLSLIFGGALILSSANIGNYILALPFMSAFVLYKKRNVLKAVAAFKDDTKWISIPLGVSLSVIAIILYVYGSSTLYALEYHIYSIPLFLSGMTLSLFNLKMLRHSIFAIAILLFLQPPPADYIGQLSAELSWISAVLLQNFFHVLGITVDLDTQVGAPALMMESMSGSRNTFVIGEPSSGVYSTIGMSIFALFIAQIATGKIWKRLLVFVISFPLFFALNTFRISLILLLWFGFGEEVSESFHLVGGTVMVAIGSIILLVAGEKIFGTSINLRIKKKTKPCVACESSAKGNEDFCLLCGSLLKELKVNLGRRIVGCSVILVLLASIVLSSQPQVDASAQLTNAIGTLDITTTQGPEATSYMLPTVNGMEPKFAYRDTNIEKVLRQDLALAFTYNQPTNNASIFNAPILYAGIQISPGTHSWEDSMVIWPSKVGRPSADVIELKDVAISDNQNGRFFVYERPNSDKAEVVLYWYQRMPLKFGSNFETRNIQIVLWGYVDNFVRKGILTSETDLSGLERYLEEFAKPIHSHWDQAKPQLAGFSLINIIVSQNYLPIIAFASIPSIFVISPYFVKNVKLRARYKALLNRLAIKDELAVIEAAQSCHGLSTGIAVAEIYKSVAGRNPDPDKFVYWLKEGRKAGILRNEIATMNDVPYMVWKTRLRGVV